jgi:hexulose-6-phosphate isomerase
MFPPEMPILRCLEIARDAGFDGVEVNLEPWHEFSLGSSEEELATLRRAIESLGLCVTAVYDREQWFYPMSSENPATRARCRDIITGLARAATELGTDTVLVMPGGTDNSVLAPEPEIVPYDVAYGNSQSVIRELAHELCEKTGVSLGVENCPSKFLYSPLEFRQFIDDIGSPWLCAYFDVGNVLPYGFPEHWIPLLGDRIKRVHLKDLRLLSDGGAVSTPLLAGDVNWPAVRTALQAVGYDGWVTAEVFPHYRHNPERLIYETSASMDAILDLGRQ